jgi:hypothetical protein
MPAHCLKRDLYYNTIRTCVLVILLCCVCNVPYLNNRDMVMEGCNCVAHSRTVQVMSELARKKGTTMLHVPSESSKQCQG